MAKIRVYKLAKELDLTNQELVAKLASLDIEVKNHMSTLSEGEVDRIRSEYSAKEEVTVAEIKIKPGVIRRRRKVEAKPPPEEEREKAEPVAGEEQPPEVKAGKPGKAQEPISPEEEEPVTEVSKEAERVSAPSLQQRQPQPVTQKTERSATEARKREPEKGPVSKPPLKKEEKGKKAFDVLQQGESEEDAEKAARKRRHGPGRKVVDYKVKKRKSLDWSQEEPGRVPGRKAIEIRREKRPAKRAPLKPVITVPKQIKRKVRMGESITVGELAKRLSIKASEIIKKLMQNGIMTNINQAIDIETAMLIANDYEYEVESMQQKEESLLSPVEEDTPELLVGRPPVVTIMGHVNHGKTRLLDAIRKTNVMESEAGGITQHIGAYTVKVGEKTIVFLDTPGHEAFTQMRARGAKVTDIVVLVVAGDDGVMPQTVEAINHAKAAKVPIIIAVNKMDLPNANMDKVKQELSEHGLMSEDWGGDTLYSGISAKEGVGIQELLEIILLQAEMLEQKANPDKKAEGVIIEARLDRTLGPVATVLVRSGTLRAGDPFVTGIYHGRVRALIDDRGERVESVGPSIPVEVLGWSGVPEAGDLFNAVEDDKNAKQLSSLRMEKVRQAEMGVQGKMTLEDLYDKIRQDEMRDLNIILKGDVQGSIEALGEALTRLSNEEVIIKILHSGVGGVTETDVMLASASNAIIIGFNVRAEIKALSLAEQESVDIRFYQVIYDAVSDLKAALTGMMKPVFKEVLVGHAEIRETFSISRIGTIAGSHVLDGKIERNSQIRLLRDNLVVYDGKLASLRRFKDDVKEVLAGYECGIRIENFNDVKNGDILEAYALEKVAPQVAEETAFEKRPA